MDCATEFRERATHCRRLADYLVPGDPTREKLLKLAEEYETAAEELEKKWRAQ